MDIAHLTAKLKEQARDQGFSLVGVTTPDPPDHLDFFRSWLEAGHHGTMGWMGSDRSLRRRADPREILPGCQSILSLAYPYPLPEQQPGRGQIACYAWNEDYHHVLGEKLETLVDFLQNQVDEEVSHRWYTDTGPILEREIATRAGLGWIGKNTTLIHPRQGSFFFLAEILLSLPLVPDSPFEGEYCGTCSRCLEACPTGCLVEPYTLDANRCISYLTIEYRESLPEELRPLLGEWIFGCDICQQVCPWNQRIEAAPAVDPALAPRTEIIHPDLEQELELSEEAFRQKFRGSPIKRTKRRGYLRNVALALGNQARQGALPSLESALEDPEPLVREHAAWAVGEIGGNQARDVLQRTLKKETNPEVTREIKQALTRWEKSPPGTE